MAAQYILSAFGIFCLGLFYAQYRTRISSGEQSFEEQETASE